MLRAACTALHARSVGAVAALLVGLLLGGCTGGSDTPSGAGRSRPSHLGVATPSPSTTPSAPAPPPPRRGACYRLSTADLARPSNDASAVPCAGRYTARTIYVGRLAGTGTSSRADADQQLSLTCPRRLAEFLGGSPRTRHLARFEVVWFSPAPDQRAAGADWFRCDLVGFARGEHLLVLPTRGSLAGVLDRKGALKRYGLCGTSAPGARGFQRVVCGQRHSWHAIDAIALTGGAAYPGARKVRKAGQATCKARARRAAGDTLRFTYGWEWPTREQWRAGQHFGYCWAPS